MVCEVDEELVDEDADEDAVDDEREEYDVAVLETSSSSAVDALVAADEPEDVAAAVDVVFGAWPANQAARPRNAAALTAPVTRRAWRAGWRFFGVVMDRACARPRKTT